MVKHTCRGCGADPHKPKTTPSQSPASSVCGDSAQSKGQEKRRRVLSWKKQQQTAEELEYEVLLQDIEKKLAETSPIGAQLARRKAETGKSREIAENAQEHFAKRSE